MLCHPCFSLLRLKLTRITPAKTVAAASIFCQLRVSIPMAMLMAVAMIGCT